VVFLDASAIIYLLEGDAAAHGAVRETLAALWAPEQAPTLAVSALSRLECRVQPLREGDDALLGRYERFFRIRGWLSSHWIPRYSIVPPSFAPFIACGPRMRCKRVLC